MTNSEKGFAPVVIILAVVILLGAGVGGFMLVSKNKSSPSLPSVSPSLPAGTTQQPYQPSSSPNQTLKTEAPSPTAVNPKELFGWWEEVESWSLDSNTGQLKKDPQAFPFQREFTDKYFCTQYSGKFICANNVIYSVNGNKISVEGLIGFYEWRIVGGLLELTSKGSKGPAFNKALSKKIGLPTSTGKITAPAVTREGMAQNPKPNLKFIKVGESGICLKHEGGDSVSVMDISFKVDGGGTFGFLSLQQLPTLIDYIFDTGEYFVFAIGSPVFKVGSRVEVVIHGETVAGPWTVEKVLRESGPVLIGGLATCP